MDLGFGACRRGGRRRGRRWRRASASASAASAADAPEPFTTTLPVISGWIAHRYENVPACLNVRFHDPPSPIVPLLNAPSLAVTVCARSSSLRNVTEPPAAIVIGRRAERTARHRDRGRRSRGSVVRRGASGGHPLQPRSARDSAHVVVVALVKIRVRAARRQPHPMRLAQLFEVVEVSLDGPGPDPRPMPLVVSVAGADRRPGGNRQLDRREAVGVPDEDGSRGAARRNGPATRSATSEAGTS